MSRRLLCLAAAAAACLATAAPAGASWRAIDGGALSASSAPLTDVAVGDDGTVVVVWRSDEEHVAVATRAPGTAMSTPTELDAPAGLAAGRPQVAVTPAGETVVLVPADDHTAVHTRAKDGAFATADPLALTGDGLDVAALADGRVVAMSSGGAIAAAVRVADSDTFGDVQTLSDATETGITGAALAAGRDGTAAVVWSSTTAGLHRVRAAILRPGTTGFSDTEDADQSVTVAGFGPARASVGDDGAIDLAYLSLTQVDTETPLTPAAIATTHRGPVDADDWSAPDSETIEATTLTSDSSLSVVTTADGHGLVAYPTATGLATLRRTSGTTSFVPEAALSDATSTSAPSFAALPDGRVATHWAVPASGTDSLGVLGADGSLAAVPGTAASAGSPSPLVANTRGLAAIALPRQDAEDPTATTIGVQLFDGAAPELSEIVVPATGTAGTAVPLSAVATEHESSPVEIEWSFGDNSTAKGSKVSHTYAQARSYTVQVTATDDAGNAVSAERKIDVTAPKPPVIPPTTPTTTTTTTKPDPEPDRKPDPESRPSGDSPILDRGAPVISDLMVLRQRFAVGARPTAMASARSNRAKRGTTLFFEVNERARVAIAVERSRQGWRSGGRCSPTRPKGAKARRAKRCAAVQVLGVIQRQAAPGLNAVGFTGRLGRKALATGRYRFSVVATDAAGNASAPALAGFTVAR